MLSLAATVVADREAVRTALELSCGGVGGGVTRRGWRVGSLALGRAVMHVEGRTVHDIESAVRTRENGSRAGTDGVRKCF